MATFTLSSKSRVGRAESEWLQKPTLCMIWLRKKSICQPLVGRKEKLPTSSFFLCTFRQCVLCLIYQSNKYFPGSLESHRPYPCIQQIVTQCPLCARNLLGRCLPLTSVNKTDEARCLSGASVLIAAHRCLFLFKYNIQRELEFLQHIGTLLGAGENGRRRKIITNP